MSTLPFEIAPLQAKQKLDAGEAALIDVREPREYDVARIAGAELIPMAAVPAQLQHLEALADAKLLIVHCHHGVRSLNVVNWLRRQGVDNCVSMSGGIESWSVQVDAKVPRY